MEDACNDSLGKFNCVLSINCISIDFAQTMIEYDRIIDILSRIYSHIKFLSEFFLWTLFF